MVIEIPQRRHRAQLREVLDLGGDLTLLQRVPLTNQGFPYCFDRQAVQPFGAVGGLGRGAHKNL
jgi:hypothetical protein